MSKDISFDTEKPRSVSICLFVMLFEFNKNRKLREKENIGCKHCIPPNSFKKFKYAFSCTALRVFFSLFFFLYFEQRVAKRQTGRDFCRFSEANSESIEVYVSIARFQPLGYYSAELSSRSPRKTHPISTHFRHFYAQRGGTLKWKHRVVAYGCRYSEITVSVYTPWFPRFSSDATVTRLPHDPDVHSPSLTCSYHCSICTV